MDSVLFYGAFLLASFWVALEPGPGFVKLSTQIATRGATRACITAIGMFTGALPYILLVAMGLSWILESIPNLLLILKIAGGLYLIWLAIDLMRGTEPSQLAANDNEGNNEDLRKCGGSTARMAIRSFLEGVMLVVLNPRTPVFYSAFLPLFVRSGTEIEVSSQLLLLGLATSGIFLITDLIFIGMISKYGGSVLQRRTVNAVARYIGATALSFLGLRLLLNRD